MFILDIEAQKSNDKTHEYLLFILSRGLSWHKKQTFLPVAPPSRGMPLIDTDKSTTIEILDRVVKRPTIDFSLFISVCYGYQIDFNASNPVDVFLFSNNLVQCNVVSLTVLLALRSEADGFVYGVCQGHFLLDDY